MLWKTITAAVVAVAAGAAFSNVALGQFFVNGDFETGDFTGWTITVTNANSQCTGEGLPYSCCTITPPATPTCNGKTAVQTVESYDIDGPGALSATLAAKFSVGQLTSTSSSLQEGIELAQTITLTGGVVYGLSFNWSAAVTSNNTQAGVFTWFVDATDLTSVAAGFVTPSTPQYGVLNAQYTPATTGSYRVGVRITRPFTTSGTTFQRVDNFSTGFAPPTFTPTNTPTVTPTNTATPSQTPTGSPTSTSTQTPTGSPTNTRTQTPTLTPTNTPTDTPTNPPTSTQTNTPTNTPTPTPTATPEDSGFVPPDVNTGKCEDLVAAHLRSLFACTTRCQVKQAQAALKGKPFDEEACEEGTAKKPASCRTKYNNATTKLLARTPSICPACLDATAQGNLADLVVSFIDNNNGLIYCAGSTPFGGDAPGFIAPDANTEKCEDLVAAHLKSLFACSNRCQVKQAQAALKGKAFDEEACEDGTAKKPVSCRTKYNKATTKLLSRTPSICPACLDATAQSNLADLVVSFIDNNNGLIYCAGSTPLP